MSSKRSKNIYMSRLVKRKTVAIEEDVVEEEKEKSKQKRFVWPKGNSDNVHVVNDVSYKRSEK